MLRYSGLPEIQVPFQRDVYARLASERLPWMSDDQRRRMQDIADRRGRGLDEIDCR